MRIRHALKANDLGRRVRFSQWLSREFENPFFLNEILIGDEAAFAMNWKVNTRNIVHYAPRGQPPEFTYDVNDEKTKI